MPGAVPALCLAPAHAAAAAAACNPTSAPLPYTTSRPQCVINFETGYPSPDYENRPTVRLGGHNRLYDAATAYEQRQTVFTMAHPRFNVPLGNPGGTQDYMNNVSFLRGIAVIALSFVLMVCGPEVAGRWMRWIVVNRLPTASRLTPSLQDVALLLLDKPSTMPVLKLIGNKRECTVAGAMCAGGGAACISPALDQSQRQRSGACWLPRPPLPSTPVAS